MFHNTLVCTIVLTGIILAELVFAQEFNLIRTNLGGSQCKLHVELGVIDLAKNIEQIGRAARKCNMKRSRVELAGNTKSTREELPKDRA